MKILKYTCQFLVVYCIFFAIGFLLSSCLRGNAPIIEVCSNGGWCSNVMYLDGQNNHLMITINLDDEGVPLISQEQALGRLEEAFGFIELSIISNLESGSYPVSGDQLPPDLLED